MNKEDKAAFKVQPTGFDAGDYVIETYFFESKIDPEDAAISLCHEQSTAQWKRVGVNEDMRPKHAAKLIELTINKVNTKPLFESQFNKGEKFYSCTAKIAHPHINFGAKIPNLLTACCGEGAFFSHGITAIKLLDLDFPKKYLANFEGPKFGVDGVRDILGIYDRPIFFGVVKPNVGLKPADFADLAYQSWLGGLDAPKDDEMLSDTPWSPTNERTKILGELRLKAEKITGEKKMFIANITDEVDRLIELHDIVVNNGCNAVMVNVMTVGLSAVRMLRKHTKVPIIAHFDLIATMSRIPFFGVSTTLLTKLQRLAGCDVVIMPGLGERMITSDEEVMSNLNVCLEPLGNIKRSLPVPGGSDWAGTLLEMCEKFKTYDFGMVPGRGVFNHPMGPKAGAMSFRQAWDAVKQGIPLNEYAKDHPELNEAIKQFS